MGRKALFALLLLGGLLMALPASAQLYKNAIGFRLGYPFGVTYKHMFSKASGLEALVGTRGRSIELVAMYEYHIYPARKAPELDVYFGGGAHVGFYGEYNPGPPPRGDRGPFWRGRPYWAYDEPYVGAGIDVIVGCSYTFKNAPINLGVDYKPSVSFLTYRGFIHGDAAISVRFIL